MDTCVGCRIVAYLFIVYWPEVTIHGCVLSTVININCPDGATYFQTVYVLKYSTHASAHGFCDCLKLTFYIANI